MPICFDTSLYIHMSSAHALVACEREREKATSFSSGSVDERYRWADRFFFLSECLRTVVSLKMSRHKRVCRQWLRTNVNVVDKPSQSAVVSSWNELRSRAFPSFLEQRESVERERAEGILELSKQRRISFAVGEIILETDDSEFEQDWGTHLRSNGAIFHSDHSESPTRTVTAPKAKHLRRPNKMDQNDAKRIFVSHLEDFARSLRDPRPLKSLLEPRNPNASRTNDSAAPFLQKRHTRPPPFTS